MVDTGSDDGTPEVARRAGARVAEAGDRFVVALGAEEAARIERRFARDGEGPLVQRGEPQFNFGQAREYASSFAREDHILQVDASDELLALDVDVLDATVRSPDPPRVEYRLQSSGLSLYVSRLYDRRCMRWEGRVHEMLWPRDPERKPPHATRTLRCADTELLVRHHGDPRKRRHYLAGLALDVIDHPERPRWTHYLGRELHFQGWHRSAIPLLEAHAARLDAWIAERAASLCLSGLCFEALGIPLEAQARYRRAIALDATRREPYLRLAALCQARNDFAGVVAQATAALAIPRTSAFAEADTNYGPAPHVFLYWALFWLGRRVDAREHWETARRLAPARHDVQAHARLFGSPVGAANPP